jgi:hypothetical protein
MHGARTLGYAGQVDCIARFDGAISVIDWKTSSARKRSVADLRDYVYQVAGYAGAINHDPNYPFYVKQAVVVVLTPEADVDIHVLTPAQLLGYWEEWRRRVHEFSLKTAISSHDSRFPFAPKHASSLEPSL